MHVFGRHNNNNRKRERKAETRREKKRHRKRNSERLNDRNRVRQRRFSVLRKQCQNSNRVVFAFKGGLRFIHTAQNQGQVRQA